MSIFKKNDLLLFQGDSITDCGRNESQDGLGSGFVSIIRGFLGTLEKDLDLKIINRGISGDRTAELLARWKEDCEDLKPSVLSIKIGVNDVWRFLETWNGQTYIGPEEYKNNYRKLLDRALSANIRRLILCSPTTIENNQNQKLSDLLAERRDITRELAREYDAVYVPFQERQLQLLRDKPGILWTLDGCHPTLAGHAALAHVWLSALGFLTD